MPQSRPSAQHKKKRNTLAPTTPSHPTTCIHPASIPLQQLILNVFKDSLVKQPSSSSGTRENLKDQIQTIKSHLFNRDFDSAFVSADADLLNAYALRWSAGRAISYVGIFQKILALAFPPGLGETPIDIDSIRNKHVLCIGGGAGAEVVALAAALRWAVGDNHAKPGLNLTVTALDIADWQPIIDRLLQGCLSHSVSSNYRSEAPPLLQPGNLTVSFQKHNVLKLSEERLSYILSPATVLTDANTQQSYTSLITLMFTLNELFSTSIPETVTMLLRMTDEVKPGAILLVVDSPGSYSTVSLGSKGDRAREGRSDVSATPESRQEEEKPRRTYPMRFLLDHALMTTTAGCWECILSEESVWFRRDRSELVYNVGEGIGLEDMRYQVHAYRRIAGK